MPETRAEKLQKLFQHYLDNQDKYVREYDGKAIVIVDYDVVGVYDSEWAAVREAQKNYEPGNFLVQFVSPGNQAYSVKIASNFVVVS